MVHLSARSINSSETSQILQNTVPSIIQASKEEKPICIPPTSNFKLEIATVSITKVTETAIRFEREWKNFSQKVNKSPITKPRPRDKTISIKGSKTIAKGFIPEELRERATPKDTAKTTRPTASSRATTGNKTSVTGPFALYCFITIRVAAGAVAVAIEPKTIAAERDNVSGIAK